MEVLHSLGKCQARAPVTTLGDPGYGVGYTLGIQIWTQVPDIPGLNCGADPFLPYECGTLPQAALFPMTLAPPPPRGCDGTHSTSNLGCPKPVKMLPLYCCYGNGFHQNQPSLVCSSPHCLWHRKAGPCAYRLHRLTVAGHSKRPGPQTRTGA